MERQKKVKSVLKEKKFFEELLSSYNTFSKEIKNLEDLYKLGSDEKNDEVMKDCENKLNNL